ncbi:hypothetical protein Pmar_PMAR016664 [Perkinsus marinus ATCC 50983]|uniref:non-specific serine/threonine protein kinase n=1 Tax=Perkinsus marinus (strain ATCC 50983 / TXsc) TaxID=423536 RepID=C5KFG7_PERM5|nr:hypothetical protein Pmar_PMAR016664 [Perkinsus marinus ATCC 50983]EER16776.1 hypothetical protein Pmar_PMAR016664 [Perkinsus marinus ATCC 50983]|eukprot:XP_002784980.1 hypothetical protein Pmar_PMAR016664 [Perkinsus marinus ATCC 50983]
MEPASSVKLSQVDSYLNDYPEISQERKCHIASYKLFKVFLFGSPITPAVEYIGKLFVPTLVQLQQQQPASGELSRIADSSLTPAPELSQTLGSDSDLTKINLRDEYAAQAVLYPNLLPYSNILVSDASAVLVRQYMQRTLTDRLYTQPTLTEMMKLWILYQLVCALAQLHALGRVHGDLKTENVFIVGGSEQVSGLGCCIAEIFSADHSHTIFDLPDALRMHSLARSSGRNDKESEAHVAQATHHVRVSRDTLLDHLRKLRYIGDGREPTASDFIQAVRRVVSDGCSNIDENTLSAVYESSQSQQFAFFQNQEHMQRPEALNGDQSIAIRMVTSAGHAGSHPRTRQVSLMILETLAPFCSRHTLLELVIPHCHAALSTEPTAECRTQALRSLVAALECIPSTADTEESLYASGQFGGVTDTGAVYSLFVDYLWPVLLSLIATRSDANLLSYSAHAAVRLAALSVTIGEMSAPSGNPSTSLEAIKAAMYNFVATYLQQVFQRAPPGNNFSMMTPNGRAVSSTTTHSPDPSQLPPRAAEAVKLAVLEALPDFASLLPPCSKEPDSSQNQNLKGSHDVSVSSLTVPPLTVQNPSSGPRPSDHKDEETKKGSPDRGLTLPYLMCFLNDPNPQVKVAFCRLAPRCANLLGAFAADVALLPYFTQTLSKELGDDRLTLAALMGATELLGDYRVLPDEGPNSVHRESVMRFAESAVPYLCHPNVCIQATARALIRSITTKHIGNALQYVYLRRRSFSHLKEAEYLPNGWRCFGDLEYLCPVSYELVLGQQTIGETLGDTTDVARIGLAKKFYEGTVSHGQPMGEPMAVSTAGPMQIIKVSISNPNVPAILPYRFIAEGDVTLGFEGSVNKLLKDWRARHLLLPPPKPALGILNRLDGSQETLYVSKKKLQIVNEIRGVLGNDGESYGMYGHRRVRAQRLHLQCRAGVDPPSVEGMTLVTSPTMEAGSSPIAMDHNSTSNISESSISVGSLQSESAPLGNVEIDHAASNDSSGYSLATPSAWRPGGSLVGTIYDFEYDFGGGGSSQSVNSMSSGHPVDGRGASHTTPVVAVDASDDGRLIIAMGGNGVLRAWRGHILEDDVAPTCSKMMPLPDEELDLAAITHYHFPMKALRNCKSVVVGGASPSLYVYRMDAPGDVPVVSLRAPTCGKSAVVFDAGIAAIESFDTDIENVVIAANHHGSVFGFDVRAGRCVFNVAEPESSLGVPTDMLCSSDGRTTVLCTRSGFVSLFDVRYLSRRTRTYKLFQEGAGTGILPITAMCNSLHGGNKSFWLAEGTHGMMGLYDFTSLDGDVRPTKLMLCGEQSNPINLPVLVDMRSQPRQSFLVGADMLTQQVKECADPSSLVVRSMLEISTSRGGPWTLLSTGNDAVVRWWQPQEAGTVIPFSNQSSIMPLQLGGVQVMTNPSYAASSGHHQSSMTPRGQGTPVEEQGDSDLRVDDGHRDAILDMCVLSLQYDILVTAGRDGLIKIWR